MIKKISLLAIVIAAVAAFIYFDLATYLTLEQLKHQQAALQEYRAENPILLALAYALIYIVVTALSLPGAALLTLTGGAVFGVFLGTILANLSATIGATLAFLIARYVLGDWVQKKFADKIEPVNKGIEQDGAFYLFTLRLVPVVPFFVINVVMGLTKIRVWTYFWVSQIGMLAGAAVYANAGTQLAKLDSLSGILSAPLLASFVLLGVFPLIAKKAVSFFRNRRSQPQG
ncbi:TVP38/TMEM64 family protein [Reinekea marinisedimentorum]|uniref:TVP38/TMEM64 family membrane protein n=1 Tax=Reinekea marinisedimentorum TaxID=230495 RepID=A0A4R3IEI9_9GAMM|nr:TVP38/TMEM64 family protein [Reinekea marinisedimentorum]TCS44018.1 putative membrane protein YdjX (TVP38/TMEM64 family) [Reinekea marinisedimentorum]